MEQRYGLVHKSVEQRIKHVEKEAKNITLER
jgi:hypothetical protein